MKTNERSPMLFSRVKPEELQEAQEAANERYDGNLSMLVRIAVREAAKAILRSRKQEANAA